MKIYSESRYEINEKTMLNKLVSKYVNRNYVDVYKKSVKKDDTIIDNKIKNIKKMIEETTEIINNIQRNNIKLDDFCRTAISKLKRRL